MAYENTTIDAGFPGFLKTWRSRRHLSQLNLSLQSGLSQRHISFLETGRSRPSRFAISQLGEALEMPAAEVDAMLISAGFAARSSQNRWDNETKVAVDAALEHILQRHAPFPAFSIDRIWNLEKANEPALRFFAMAGATDDTNLLRCIMAPGVLRSNIVNWKQTTQKLFRALELETARRPHDKEAHDLLDELQSYEGVVDIIKKTSLESPKPIMTIQFRIGKMVLELFSLIATIGMSTDAAIDDIRVETLFPATDMTRDWFIEQFSTP